MVTEIVKFNTLKTTNDKQLLSSANNMINGLQKKHEGFFDAEMVKGYEDFTWCIIYHLTSIELTKANGEKSRENAIFHEFNKFIEPGSIVVELYRQLSKY